MYPDLFRECKQGADLKRIDGRWFKYQGLFTTQEAKELARQWREKGWRVRLQKVQNVSIKGKHHRTAHKVWAN